METISTSHMDAYRLVKRLGKSSTGETYKAEDQTLGIPLILKILDPALGKNEAFLHRYQTAWRAAAQWNNRHMVRVLAFRRTSRQVYVVTEYLRGKSLEQIILQNGALPCSAALPLIKRLLRVVHLAHSRGIFCLDLKPRNIFLTPTGLILTDVDTATILLDTTHSLPRLDHAALSAIPPEYFTGQGARDHRGQIYALGITLYQMLSGRLPFDSRLSPQELPRRIVREPIPSLRLYNPEIPRPLETLVTTALAKVPGDRYSSVEEMLRDFLTLEEHHPAVIASSEAPQAPPSPGPLPEQESAEQAPASENPEKITGSFFTNGAGTELPEQKHTPSQSATPPSDAPTPERSDEMVGQYRLVEKVAEDEEGEWYRAVATRSRRTVALKFLPPEQLRDRERRRRFVNEVEAANALRHFGIVRVHEIGTAGGREFLALEWVEGQRLSDLLQNGPLELEPAVSIAVQIAEVLQRTHQSGIIHGALHPSCVHITPDGVVRLSGFGFAALWAGRPLTREEPFLPTCSYLAPEVVLGNIPEAGCDIFSLGVMLYEMLSGQHPFRRETTRETIFAIVMNDRRPLEEVVQGTPPPELVNIVERALAKHGHERYESMHQMAEDLMAVKARVQELQVASTFSLIGDEGNSLFGYQSVEELLAQRQKIDQLIAVQHTKYLTVMFCDLVDSTTYFERRGDLEGRVMVQRYYGLMTPLIKKHEGTLVKTIGDGILATFVNPADACHCAREMQEALQEYNRDKQEMDHIRVRIALHYGRAVIEKGDIFGDVVNVTARVEEMAGAGEILLSETVYHRCRTQPEFTFAPCGTCRFKGKSGEIGVYRLVWNPEAEKENPPSPAPSPNGHLPLSPEEKEAATTGEAGETGETVSELPAMEETLIAPRNSSIRILRRPPLKTPAAEPEPTPREIINPYMNRVKIKNIEEFYGRKAEVAKIYARLDADRPQSVSIVGERRIGKSSLLNYIAHPANRTNFLRRPEQYVFVCIDFQEKHRLDIPGFISAVYEALQVSFGGGLQMEVPPTYEGLKQVVTTLEESGYKLIMLFDEFERVTRNPNFDAEFFSFCRSIANNYNVAYVVASGRNLQSLCHSREIADSPFFNIFSNITLSQFPHQEAVELIVQPARKHGLFMEPHIPFILDIAGYYPIFIQMACAAVFEFLRREDTFTEATYERIREEFLDEARVHFQHIWSSCNEVQQETLRNLARKRSLSDSQSYVLKELIRAGYVKLQDQEPRIFSSLFEEFVLRQGQVRPNTRSRFPFWRRD